jgi:hypothetical protein|tara:strand:- start:275 stop:460 length:186 start_codon:yes stop_codon:yes gene_type:complete
MQEIYQNNNAVISVTYCVNGNIEVDILEGYNEYVKVFKGFFSQEKFNEWIKSESFEYVNEK